MMRSNKKAKLMFIFGIFGTFFLFSQFAIAGPYGRGKYGECVYQNCFISVASSGTVALALTPTGSGVVTIAKDDVTVSTNSEDGFTLSLESSSGSENGLVGTSGTIATASATASSPAVLPMNKWGFRVDGQAGFGAGPTSVVTNASSSALTFAGIPLGGSPVSVKTYSSSAPSGESTEFWFGARVDNTITADTYTQTVIYTAIAL